MSPALSVVAALALAHQCAPDVAPETIVGIAKTESGLHVLSVHDNTSGARYAPQTPDAAVVLATSLVVAQHHNVDLGLMQVNSANLAGSVASFGIQQPWGSIGAAGVRDKARKWMGAGVSKGGNLPLR